MKGRTSVHSDRFVVWCSWVVARSHVSDIAERGLFGWRRHCRHRRLAVCLRARVLRSCGLLCVLCVCIQCAEDLAGLPVRSSKPSCILRVHYIQEITKKTNKLQQYSMLLGYLLSLPSTRSNSSYTCVHVLLRRILS